MFKNIENISDYNYDHEITKKRLDVLGLPFKTQL